MNNIVLIGMMGSGKSTLSHLLYEKTGFEIVDCDDGIEQSENMSISDIFSVHGESYFRKLEHDFLMTFNQSNCIVSTGGGMILSAENRKMLKGLGHVVYLSGTVETLYNRLLTQTENRPLLTGTALHDQLADLLLKRRELYLDTADSVVSIDNKSPEAVVLEIYAILRELDYKFLT